MKGKTIMGIAVIPHWMNWEMTAPLTKEFFPVQMSITTKVKNLSKQMKNRSSSQRRI